MKSDRTNTAVMNGKLLIYIKCTQKNVIVITGKIPQTEQEIIANKSSSVLSCALVIYFISNGYINAYTFLRYFQI